MKNLIDKIKRVLQKPPRFIMERIFYEIKVKLGRLWEPYLPCILTSSFILRKFKHSSLNDFWSSLALKPFCTESHFFTKENYETLTSDKQVRILNKAEEILNHKVDLLGSGLISLGENIDWNRDYKSSFSWPNQYFSSISYSNLDRPSDVKFPWEISRMQWMIPLGQAYLLTKDEKYAEKTKNFILSWIDTNPYAYSVNWACTMDVALRIIVWTWFFHVFNKSESWKELTFREKFLKSLYLHGSFTSRHLEKSDVNGNHYTADAAGLVFAGLFFGNAPWHQTGWKILEEEIKLQVFKDGVDFEASIPYHRLVQELFFFPALYRLKQGLKIPTFYEERLYKMAFFTACYSRIDGSVPLWGDADDARVLPFGDQALNDHRYLIGLIGTSFSSQKLLPLWSGSNTEMFWVYGNAPLSQDKPSFLLPSQSFPMGGFYIMRDDENHVFIDCGPLGLKGRGGHGHNDILSFEAVLNNTHLITDCGAYLYTANYIERNNFRSTSYHNTPQIDEEEINRFIRPDFLWTLHQDARPKVETWITKNEFDLFQGTHTGYEKLMFPVKPTRTIKLDHQTSELTIEDFFEGEESHSISIPFHLHPSVFPEIQDANSFLLKTSTDTFVFKWESSCVWNASIETARISQSYGTIEKSSKILLKYKGMMGISLKTTLFKRRNS